MGGFGWAARQLSRTFREDPSLGVDLVYLAGELRATPEMSETEVHGSRLILRRETRLGNMYSAWRERFDLLLTIDYNLSHSVFIRSLPRTPLIIWVRDPRTPADIIKIRSLTIPGAASETVQGLECVDGRSLAGIASESRWLHRRLLLASPAPHLVSKLAGAYGFEPWDFYFLPNVIRLEPDEVVESEQPSVVFLGRLDPIKRPWIFSELARRFPQVQFLFLGRSHFEGPGSWRPVDVAPNVRFCGHVGETEKLRLLSAAWVAVNTSIHEGLAVSLLEALACETPLLSCQNPAFVVSRFGIYTGRFDGSGIESLDAFADGLQTLLGDPDLRHTLAKRGREWVRNTHSRERFIDAFFRLCDRAGVSR